MPQPQITICPRYWGRLWRYRWIIYVSGYGVVMDGYAWTKRGADQIASKWQEYLSDLQSM